MRKIKIAIVILLTLFTAPTFVSRIWAANGSDPSFARTYGGTAAFVASSVQQTSDGGFIVAGATSPPQTWLLRLDGTGGVMWQKGYGILGPAFIQTSYVKVFGPYPGFAGPKALQTPDGGFIVASATQVTPSTTAAWIFRVDGMGGLIWQEAFTGVGNATAFSVDLTSDGGFVVAGFTVGPAGTPSALVLKLDKAGVLAWQKSYAIPVAFSVRQTDDGGYIVAGNNATFVGSLLRLDSGGGVVWQKTYPDPRGFNLLLSGRQTSDGGFVAAGFTSLSATAANAIVLRLSPTGDLVWQKSYTESAATSTIQTADGGFVVVGAAVPSVSAVSPLGAVVLRLDSLGNVLWQRVFEPPSSQTAALSGQPTSDGGVVIAGITGVPMAASVPEALVFKLDAEGQINSCPMLSPSSLVASGASITPRSLIGPSVTVSTSPVTTTFTPVNTSATTTPLCLAVSGISISVSFTDSSLNPLRQDSKGNPVVNVTLVGGIVRSTNPGHVVAWVNVTNTSGSAVQSLKLDDTLPKDWVANPAWMPGLGAIHVFYANTTSLSTNPEITQPSTITVSTGNPETVHLAIANLTATAIGHPLMPGQSILLSVKLTYALIGTSQSASSYPRNYADTATAAAWTQLSFTGNQFTGTGSAFFIADAKVVS